MSEPTSELSEKGVFRRRLLKGAGAAALGVGLFGLGYEAMRQGSQQETIRDFSTDGVDYRFLGGAHGNKDYGHLNLTTSFRRESIPEGTTVFELETGDLDYLSPDIYSRISRLYTHGPTAEPYAAIKDVFLALTERKLPLVVTDVPVEVDPEMFTLMGGLSIGAAIGLAARKDANLTRRKFLQGGTGVFLGLLGTRGVSDHIATYLRSCANEEWAQTIAQINHNIELSKPDSLVLTFRNALNAAKTLGLEDHFPRNKDTHRPKPLLVYGSGHWGMPEYIQSGQQTIIDYLSLYPKPFIEKFFGKDNPHLYTSVIITPENDGFKTEKVENPGLKALFQ